MIAFELIFPLPLVSRRVGELVELVRQRIGPVASFKTALPVRRLPKTRSGKSSRDDQEDRRWRAVYHPAPPTIDDPAILVEISADLAAIGYPPSRTIGAMEATTAQGVRQG